MDKRFFLSVAISVAGGGAIDPALSRRLAVTADRAGFDMLVMKQPGDAMIAASWMIPATRRIGLVSTVAATFSQPFHVARGLAAMDILSGGRMGWLPEAAHHHELTPRFGALASPPLPDALAKAVEFVTATEALWDSWDHDALIVDKASARYLDSAKIRRVAHRGEHFQIMGPLNSARPPQGYPVLALDDSDPLFDRLPCQADVLLITADGPPDLARRLPVTRNARPRRILAKIPCDGAAADRISAWRDSAACDGCHLVSEGPDVTEAVLTKLSSELRRRGLPMENGAPETLRARLGLPLPINPYSRADTKTGA